MNALMYVRTSHWSNLHGSIVAEDGAPLEVELVVGLMVGNDEVGEGSGGSRITHSLPLREFDVDISVLRPC